jgi:hypothetical protein
MSSECALRASMHPMHASYNYVCRGAYATACLPQEHSRLAAYNVRALHDCLIGAETRVDNVLRRLVVTACRGWIINMWTVAELLCQNRWRRERRARRGPVHWVLWRCSDRLGPFLAFSVGPRRYTF